MVLLGDDGHGAIETGSEVFIVNKENIEFADGT